MNRIGTLQAASLLTVALLYPAYAHADCRSKATSKAATMYTNTAKEFDKCSKIVVQSGTCNKFLRDAKVQTKLALTQKALLSACKDPVAGTFGFASDDDLAVRVAGVATGEGRQVADSVYGRDPVTLTLTSTQFRCAKQIVGQTKTAGKKAIKTLMKCGLSCGAPSIAVVDAAYNSAASHINSSCSAADLTALIGGNLTTYLSNMRAGAQRVVNSLTPGINPVVTITSPIPGSVITPPSLPADVPVIAGVGNVPHAGYVSNVQIVGGDATYNATNGKFERTVSVTNPHQANYSIFVKAYTYLGIVSGTDNVKFNLGTLAPDVVITSPASGIITNNSSITVQGQVIGDLANANLLVVGGQFTNFNPGNGAFSVSVPLTSDQVQIIDAFVQSFNLGTVGTDTVVVLKGPALSLGSRVQGANHNRLNNSGFGGVGSLVLGGLESQFSPSAFIGMQINGGTITEFSTGPFQSDLHANGTNSVLVDINIPSFHLKLENIDSGILGITCTLTYDASNVAIVYSANLEPKPPDGNGLTAYTNSIQTTFSNPNANLSGGFLGICSLATLLVDVNDQLQSAFQDQIAAQLPSGVNQALGGIDIAGPLGQALNVTIDAVYASAPEDSAGITFNVDTNVIALAPVPDAPTFTQTLNPVQVGAPVFGPNVPNTSQPFDLAFCLSEGFINRFMAALMMEGLFNQSITEISPGQPITTALLSFLFGDQSYNTACPNCPVTMTLHPTAGPVARAPQPGESADIVLIIPNYRFDAVALNGNTPVPLVSATVVFSMPVTLGASGSVVSPTIGDLSITNVKVIANSIGADEDALAAGVATLFPLAAQSLGSLFTAIPLPPFQGLQLYGVGSGWNVSCAALYLSFTAPPPTPTPTRTLTRTVTATATQTRTNTPGGAPTATPTRTPSPSATDTPGSTIGNITMTLASGSQASIQAQTIKIGPLNLTGHETLQFGPTDGNGVATVVIPVASVHFDPLTTPFGTVCVQATMDGNGIIDCDGGTANLNLTLAQDHNTTPGDLHNSGSASGLPDDATCTNTATYPDGSMSTACVEGTPMCDPTGPNPGICHSPVVSTQSGTLGPGDTRIAQQVTIQILQATEFGVDGMPCTGDDMPATPPEPVTIFLSTGMATGQIFDANDVNCKVIGPGKTCGSAPCLTQVTGVPFNCASLRNGIATGGTLVMALPALDAPTIHDGVTTFQLIAQ